MDCNPAGTKPTFCQHPHTHAHLIEHSSPRPNRTDPAG